MILHNSNYETLSVTNNGYYYNVMTMSNYVECNFYCFAANERSSLLANPAADNALVTVKLNNPHTQIDQEEGGCCHRGRCACSTCCTGCQHSRCTIL
jgi:hypothetical protein